MTVLAIIVAIVIIRDFILRILVYKARQGLITGLLTRWGYPIAWVILGLAPIYLLDELPWPIYAKFAACGVYILTLLQVFRWKK
jgi:hypothetical protein